MAQYIDKDTIVAEIKRLQKVYKQIPTHSNYEDGLKEGRLIGYIDALNKINKLEVIDIDAIKRDWYNEGYIKGRKEANIPARELGLPSALDFINELPVNKDLEEAAKYHRSHGNYGGDINLAMEESFKVGAQWKEQLIKSIEK